MGIAGAAGLGAVLVALSWLNVSRTVFSPSAAPLRLNHWVTRAVATAVGVLADRLPESQRSRLLAQSGPLALFALCTLWLLGSCLGFALLACAAEAAGAGWPSPSRLLALQLGAGGTLLVVLGWVSAGLLAAVFAVHLFRVTNAYSRRELLVARLSARAKEPTDAERMLSTYVRSDSRDQLDDWFAECAGWLADIWYTHIGYPALVHFRPAGRLSWLKAAVIVLDAAALVEASAPGWSPPHARALLDTGSCCLQRLAEQLGVALPRPVISLQGREQHTFTESVNLAFPNLPIEGARDDIWRAFQEERTRYAPYATSIAQHLRYELVQQPEVSPGCPYDAGRRLPAPRHT